MSFRLVFIAVTRLRIGLAAFLINRDRPSIETEQPMPSSSAPSIDPTSRDGDCFGTLSACEYFFHSPSSNL
jgi:hypothetical protein